MGKRSGISLSRSVAPLFMSGNRIGRQAYWIPVTRLTIRSIALPAVSKRQTYRTPMRQMALKNEKPRPVSHFLLQLALIKAARAFKGTFHQHDMLRRFRQIFFW